MVSERAQEKQLTLIQDVQAIPLRLLGDVTRLKQALLNYLTNAIKFSDQGSIALRSRIEHEDSDSVLVRFEVQDHGIGIPAETIPRLFTPFEQADNSMTRRYGGTGLGLAITRRLAELMGGSAGVESVLGQGSTFWFTARLKRGAATATVPVLKLPGAQAEQMLKAACLGQRILVVEDDRLNQEVLRLSLEGAGLALDLAETGDVAVEMVARQAYALILMDMQMPRMGGIEATRRIRALSTGAQVPIIAMTANAFSEDRERCLAVGMNDFISKPFKLDKLFETILTWLPGGRAP